MKSVKTSARGPNPRTNPDPQQISNQERWYSMHSDTVKAQPLNPILDTSDRDSIPYKLCISQINNLKLTRKDKNSQVLIKVSATLISKSKRINVGTLQNILIPVHYTQKGSFTLQEPGILYYHSRINKSNQDIAMLLEFYLLEKSRTTQGTSFIGYSLIQPFSDARSAATTLKKGSWMRSDQQSTTIQCKYSLSYSIELKNLVRLIPQNSLYSTNRSVPCLVRQTLPNTPDKEEIMLSESLILNIKKFQIVLNSKYEPELKSAIERMKESFCREDRSSRVNIKKRQIRIGYHNGLTMVSDTLSDLEFVKEGKKEPTRLRIVEDREKDGELEIEIWRNNGVLVCCLVYEVELEGKDYGQKMKFEVGLFIKSFTKERYGSIEDTLMMGPGYGIDGNLLKLSVAEPTINFEYVVQENTYRNNYFSSREPQYLPKNTGKSKGKNPRDKSDDEYSSPMKGLKSTIKSHLSMSRGKPNHESFYAQQQQRARLEEQINLLKSKHQIREVQKVQLTHQLKHQRQQYMDTQQRMQDDVTVLTKDQVTMQYQIRQLQEKLRLLENLRENERKQRQEETKTALIEKQKLAELERNSYNKPGSKTFVKNKREAEISSMLYDVLEKKFITPLIKNSEAIDPVEFEQFKAASKFTINFLSIRWDQPKTLYVVVRFFNIAGFRTSNIKQSSIDAGEGRLIKESLSMSMNEMDAMYQFLIDPSLSSNPESLQGDLVNYLWNKNLILDVYDAGNHFYLGQLNFGLKDILRGKKERVISVKQHLLVSDGKPICNLHIMITNEKVDCRRQGGIAGKIADNFNRILSTTAMVIPTNQQTNFLEGALKQSITKSDRRMEKIRMDKQRKLFESGSKDLNPLQKQQYLRSIQMYKNTNKTEFIKEIYHDFMHEHRLISCFFGRAQVFSYTFTNSEQRTTEFRVNIQDPDEHMFTIPELTLVNKPLDWRHFCEVKNYQFPKSFECISEGNVFKLAPNESLEMVFRFLSLRRMTGYGEDYEIRERMLNILVMNTSNNSIASGFSLKVEPHEQVIDRSIIMYENGDEPVQLIVPLLNQLPKSSSTKPFLISTFIQSTVNWLSEYELSIKVQSLPIMNRLIFNVILYQNQYMDSIKENWRIQLNSYQGITLTCKQNSPVKFRLAIPQQFCNKRVFLFTSSSEVSFLSNISNGMFTAQNTLTVISGQAVNPSNQKKSVLVHLLDGDTRALLYGWKINILPWNTRNVFM